MFIASNPRHISQLWNGVGASNDMNGLLTCLHAISSTITFQIQQVQDTHKSQFSTLSQPVCTSLQTGAASNTTLTQPVDSQFSQHSRSYTDHNHNNCSDHLPFSRISIPSQTTSSNHTSSLTRSSQQWNTIVSILHLTSLPNSRQRRDSTSNSTSTTYTRCFSATAWDPPKPPQNRRVVVTGLGLVTPLGVGVTNSWEALIAGKTSVRGLTEECLPQSHRSLLKDLPCKVAALVPKDQLQPALDELQEDARRCSPYMLYGLLAAKEALSDARWEPSSLQDRMSTGVCMGSGMSSCTEIADAWTTVAGGRIRKLSPFFVPRILPNMAAGAVGIRWGLHGPNHAVSTACATGLHAIGDAYRMVQRGDAEVMVAGAAEACIDALSLAGFSRLKALSTKYNDTPQQASRPFDEGRDGFVMGEGSGALVIESHEHAVSRGARIYAEIRGYGLSGDGHHITQPHPEGLGGRLCMSRAIAGSGIPLEDIAHVNAHATSTPQGDEVEAAAISAVWGDHLSEKLAVSSTKGATGHLLGAAGAVEVVFTILALHHHVAPPTANLTNPGPINLPGLVGPVAKPLPAQPAAAICNSFGFGGTNACLLVATPP